MTLGLQLLALLLTLVAGLRLQDHRQISHHQFYLGRKRGLSGYALVHYHHDYASPHNRSATGALRHHHHRQPAPRKRQAAAAACTAPIAEGAKWRRASGYYLHTRNTQGLSEDYVRTSIARAMDAWQCVLGALDIETIGPLLGVRRNTRAADFPLDRPTGENEIGFGPIDGRPGTVAVTVVWGLFGGPVGSREIREFKMRFDEQHYLFGNASLSGVFMDLEAIATHEAGHAHGLDDIYRAGCDQVTMFGTSRTGERKKRSLDAADAAGLVDLYDDSD